MTAKNGQMPTDPLRIIVVGDDDDPGDARFEPGVLAIVERYRRGWMIFTSADNGGDTHEIGPMTPEEAREAAIHYVASQAIDDLSGVGEELD